jgi:thioesterase domain-containing protein
MSDTSDISEARRLLLEKYLRGDLKQTTQDTAKQDSRKSAVSLISEHTSSTAVPVVPLQVNGSKPPFFYLHPHVEGGAFYCFTLAHYIGSDQPFYVLDPCKFDGLPTPLTLEVMAAAYVKTIRDIQPAGPYFLGGFCGGGLIAFEAARQIRSMGQEIGLLLLIEAKDGPAPHRMHFRKSLGNFVRHTGKLIRLSQKKQCDLYIFLEKEYIYLRHIYDFSRICFRRLQNTLGLGTAAHQKHGIIGDKGGVKFPRPRDFGITGKYIGEASEDWIGKFVWAISHYNTCQYPGKVEYFWASHTIEQEQLHFRRVEEGQVAEAERIVSHIIPGNHSSIINEQIHDFAECLRVSLRQAQEEIMGD